jgi:hypothetical protein
VDSSGLGLGPVAGSCKHDNEPFVFHKRRGVFSSVNNPAAANLPENENVDSVTPAGSTLKQKKNNSTQHNTLFLPFNYLCLHTDEK